MALVTADDSRVPADNLFLVLVLALVLQGATTMRANACNRIDTRLCSHGSGQEGGHTAQHTTQNSAQCSTNESERERESILANRCARSAPRGTKSITARHPEQDRTGQNRTGQDRTGQVRSSQDRQMPDHGGFVRTGHPRTGHGNLQLGSVSRTLPVYAVCRAFVPLTSHGPTQRSPRFGTATWPGVCKDRT